MAGRSFNEEPKVRAWIASMQGAGCTVHALTPVNLFHKKNGELLFGVFRGDVSDPQGNKLPDILFMRGNACIVVPRIVNAKTGEEAFLMILQRRIGNGLLNLEFPAGMLDRSVGDPASVARRELFEETGLDIGPEQLFSLCARPLYSSPGASDEAIHYFGCRVTLPEEQYSSFEGRCIENGHEGEHITVTLRSKSQAEKQTVSLQARLGLHLFENYFR